MVFIKCQGVMFLVCPVDTGVEHGGAPSVFTWLLKRCALLLRRSKRDFLITSSLQEPRQGSASFLNRSSRGETRAFPWHVQQFTRASVPLAPALCRVGLMT